MQELAPSEEQDRFLQTPILAAKAWRELCAVQTVRPEELLYQQRLPADSFQGRVGLPNLAFLSICEHALLPYFGEVEIQFEPQQWLAGAGAFEQIVRACSQKLSLQESLNQRIFEVIRDVLEPRFLQVRIEARHTCMQGRILTTCCVTSMKAQPTKQ
ncbi:MAG: GTP cyclohydrolase I [Myxococcaceae bacterium]|nr:GTP cyclohydrolase I [Myxococcaceae bacterium]